MALATEPAKSSFAIRVSRGEGQAIQPAAVDRSPAEQISGEARRVPICNSARPPRPDRTNEDGSGTGRLPPQPPIPPCRGGLRVVITALTNALRRSTDRSAGAGPF